MRSSIASLLALCLVGLVSALSSTGTRLLVILDDASDKDKYTQFWGDLNDRGYQITYSTPKSDPTLFIHGDLAYDHLLLLPTKLKTLGPALTPNILLDFAQKNGNILLGLSADVPIPTSLVSLLLELDIHLSPDRNALVVDHFNYDAASSSEKHDVLLLTHPPALRADVKNYFSGEGVLAVPRAVGHVLGNTSPLLTPILKAPSTAYSYNPKEEAEGAEEPFATGSQLALISAMQARNSARFTVLGSAEMLEDKWFDAQVTASGSGDQSQGPSVATGNREFAKKVAGWTFQEIGVLKVGRVSHHLNGDDLDVTPVNNTGREVTRKSDEGRKMYRIKNDVTYTITLSEYTWDHLAPFTLAAHDNLQLEFTMLNPYHRISLTPSAISRSSNSTSFTTTFRIPDQHGIFNFRVNYKRPFMTYIDEKDTVTVRHFAHDEWPRSWAISGAWVWIVGVWGTVAAWVVFVGVWLYSEPTSEGSRRKVKKVQ